LNLFLGLNLLSAGLFLFYGLHCLFSEKMISEFSRYGLSQYRSFVGALEILGALGQLLGFWVPELGLFASTGLALLMLCGVWARWRIKDPFTAFLPAVVLGLVNGILVWLVWKKV